MCDTTDFKKTSSIDKPPRPKSVSIMRQKFEDRPPTSLRLSLLSDNLMSSTTNNICSHRFTPTTQQRDHINFGELKTVKSKPIPLPRRSIGSISSSKFHERKTLIKLR